MDVRPRSWRGSVDGVVGRVLMRLFAIAGEGVPVFTLVGSLGIAMFFVLSGVPGGIASAMGTRPKLTWTLYLLGTAPLAWNGLAIGSAEWSAAADRDLSPSDLAVLSLLTAGIVAVTLVNPFLTHRLAVRWSRARTPSSNSLHHSLDRRALS